MNTIKNLSNILSVNAKSYAIGNYITAQDIGKEDFNNWKMLCNNVRKACYSVRRNCRISGGDVNYSPIFDAVKVVFAMLGNVNGRPMVCDNGTAAEVMAWALKTQTVYDNPEVELLLTALNNDRRTLRTYQKTNGTNPDAIKALENSIESNKEKYSKLMSQANNAHKDVTIVSEATFRKAFEKFLGDRINKQNMKTLVELEAEEQARKDARKEKAKERKKARRDAAKKAEVSADAK